MIDQSAKYDADQVIQVIEQMRDPGEAKFFLEEMIRHLGGTASTRNMPLEVATIYALALLVKTA